MFIKSTLWAQCLTVSHCSWWGSLSGSTLLSRHTSAFRTQRSHHIPCCLWGSFTIWPLWRQFTCYSYCPVSSDSTTDLWSDRALCKDSWRAVRVCSSHVNQFIDYINCELSVCCCCCLLLMSSSMTAQHQCHSLIKTVWWESHDHWRGWLGCYILTDETVHHNRAVSLIIVHIRCKPDPGVRPHTDRCGSPVAEETDGIVLSSHFLIMSSLFVFLFCCCCFFFRVAGKTKCLLLFRFLHSWLMVKELSVCVCVSAGRFPTWIK